MSKPTVRRDRPPTLERSVALTAQNYGVAAVLALVTLLVVVPWWFQWCLLYLGGVAFLTSVIGPHVEDWRPKGKVSTRGKAVFISGCDSGFGHLLARRLDDSGLTVFAGCLFPENKGALTLKKTSSKRLHVLPIDVTSDESVRNATNYVTSHLGNNKLWAVVNNAGVGEILEVAWTPVDSAKRVFEVNTFGVMRTTKAFLPLLCRDKGRIVTVASAAGRYSYPGLVTYCMSKQAAVAFSEGLRIESYRFGVKVITVEPFMYKTNITKNDHISDIIKKTWEKGPEEVKKLYNENYVERYKRAARRILNHSISDRPQEVVDCMEEAVLALEPKYAYSPGTVYSKFMFWFLSRLPKPLADRLIHDEFVADL